MDKRIEIQRDKDREMKRLIDITIDIRDGGFLPNYAIPHLPPGVLRDISINSPEFQTLRN